jgi:hypothetical protein
MLTSTIHILPLATIVRTRVLPQDGRVLVRPGQKVSPSDVIAETSVSRKHVVLNIAEELQVQAAKVDAFVKVKRGQKIAKGDLLADAGGLFGRETRSPIDGRIVALGGGKLVVEISRASIEVRSGLVGTVTELVGERGAIIRASGAIIQGVWGNGKVDAGVLVSLIEKPADVLTPAQLDVSLRGSVILAGHVADPNVLKSAAEMPVRGLILASLSPTLLATALQMPYPILLLDGFGNRPMNSIAFKLLSTNIKRDVAINADIFEKNVGNRPEIFISLPFSQEPPEPRDVEMFAPGQTVRVLSLTKPCQIGAITVLPADPVSLPNGIKTLSASVRLETGDEILVALSNLEVLG